MARSVKKGPYVFERLFAKVQKMNQEGKKEVVKTWSRRSTIFPDFIGHTFENFHLLENLVDMLVLRKKVRDNG